MDELEIRELRAFATVARELHFGRAAQQLNVAQPALSRTIAKLETRLGVRLIARTTRSATLTPAGEVLLAEATAVLDAATAAARRTRRAGDPSTRLVVALKALNDRGTLNEILAAYAHESDGGPEPELLITTSPDVARSLRDGRSDVALLSAPFDLDGLDRELLVRRPRLVALPADHPLATRTRLTLADLAGEVFVTWADSGAELAAHWSAPGARPGPEVTQMAQALLHVELSRALTFVLDSAAEPNPAIVYRPVDGLAASEQFVVWPQRSRSPAVAAFVRAAVDVTARAAPALRVA
jgi:DNA-binding transcriptional LysR family regulator